MKSEIKNKGKVEEKSKGNSEDKNKGGFKERRLNCINSMNQVSTILIKGKNYSMVKDRLQHVLKFFPEIRIDEQIFFQDEKSEKKFDLFDFFEN